MTFDVIFIFATYAFQYKRLKNYGWHFLSGFVISQIQPNGWGEGEVATQTNHKHSASDSTITLRPISISLSHLLFILFTFLQFLWANRRGRRRWRLRRLPGGVSKSNKDTKDNKASSSGMVKDTYVNISIKIIPTTIEGICLIATLRLCWNGELEVEVVHRGKFMQLEINIMFMFNVSLCDGH